MTYPAMQADVNAILKHYATNLNAMSYEAAKALNAEVRRAKMRLKANKVFDAPVRLIPAHVATLNKLKDAAPRIEKPKKKLRRVTATMLAELIEPLIQTCRSAEQVAEESGLSLASVYIYLYQKYGSRRLGVARSQIKAPAKNKH